MPERTSSRRLLRVLVGIVAVLAAVCLCLELGLRFLLFSDLELAVRRGRALREPGLYSSPSDSDEYWKLMYAFADPARRRPNPGFDAALGWVRPGIDPETYAHAAEPAVRGRRPVLLFGDSFAACVTEPQECWQGLLERSGLADRFALLNYGVGGYGFDQTVLLMQRVVARFAEQDPVVIVSVLVDSDLDRSVLEFRGWPKPRFTWAAGALEPGPPLPDSTAAFLEEHPIGIRSYLWRYVVYGTSLLPLEQRQRLMGERERLVEKERLNRAIVALAAAELEARGLAHFFLLFHGKDALGPDGRNGWQERLLHEELARHGTPWVSSKPLLLEAARKSGRAAAELYFREGLGLNHYTAEGNAVVFDAIRLGLAGRFHSAHAAPRADPEGG